MKFNKFCLILFLLLGVKMLSAQNSLAKSEGKQFIKAIEKLNEGKTSLANDLFNSYLNKSDEFSKSYMSSDKNFAKCFVLSFYGMAYLKLLEKNNKLSTAYYSNCEKMKSNLSEKYSEVWNIGDEYLGHEIISKLKSNLIETVRDSLQKSDKMEWNEILDSYRHIDTINSEFMSSSEISKMQRILRKQRELEAIKKEHPNFNYEYKDVLIDNRKIFRTQFFKNGDKYEGDFGYYFMGSDDSPTFIVGNGKYTFKDGSFYEGSWYKGKKNGEFKYTKLLNGILQPSETYFYFMDSQINSKGGVPIGISLNIKNFFGKGYLIFGRSTINRDSIQIERNVVNSPCRSNTFEEGEFNYPRINNSTQSEKIPRNRLLWSKYSLMVQFPGAYYDFNTITGYFNRDFTNKYKFTNHFGDEQTLSWDKSKILSESCMRKSNYSLNYETDVWGNYGASLTEFYFTLIENRVNSNNFIVKSFSTQKVSFSKEGRNYFYKFIGEGRFDVSDVNSKTLVLSAQKVVSEPHNYAYLNVSTKSKTEVLNHQLLNVSAIINNVANLGNIYYSTGESEYYSSTDWNVSEVRILSNNQYLILIELTLNFKRDDPRFNFAVPMSYKKNIGIILNEKLQYVRHAEVALGDELIIIPNGEFLSIFDEGFKLIKYNSNLEIEYSKILAEIDNSGVGETAYDFVLDGEYLNVLGFSEVKHDYGYRDPIIWKVNYNTGTIVKEKVFDSGIGVAGFGVQNGCLTVLYNGGIYTFNW